MAGGVLILELKADLVPSQQKGGRCLMKDRIKWLCAGVGVMYGLQLIILLVVHNLIPSSAPPGFSNLVATVVYTLVAFMGGGFVIGLMAERIEIAEPVIATIVTL